MNLEGLNPAQRQAVKYVEGPLVVFAGAGSGKTRVITYRIAHLISECGVPPHNILAVTFTNKAAGEMRERLAALVPGNEHTLTVGTFHSVCARLLRRFAEHANVDAKFSIYDESDQVQLVKRVLKELEIDPKKFAPKTVARAINAAKQEVITPDAYAGNDYFTDKIAEIYPVYDEHMRRTGRARLW